MNTRDLLVRVEAYLVAHNMAPTTFGMKCLKNPAFVFRLRAGMDHKSSTVDRVISFMENGHGVSPKSRRAGNRKPGRNRS